MGESKRSSFCWLNLVDLAAWLLQGDSELPDYQPLNAGSLLRCFSSATDSFFFFFPLAPLSQTAAHINMVSSLIDMSILWWLSQTGSQLFPLSLMLTCRAKDKPCEISNQWHIFAGVRSDKTFLRDAGPYWHDSLRFLYFFYRYLSVDFSSVNYIHRWEQSQSAFIAIILNILRLFGNSSSNQCVICSLNAEGKHFLLGWAAWECFWSGEGPTAPTDAHREEQRYVLSRQSLQKYPITPKSHHICVCVSVFSLLHLDVIISKSYFCI